MRPETLLAGVLHDSVEQLAQELDPKAGQIVTDLVVILHERRPPGSGASGGAAP